MEPCPHGFRGLSHPEPCTATLPACPPLHQPDQCKHPLRPLRGGSVYGMLAIMSTGMNSASRVVSARIPREQYPRLIELANASGQTRGEYVRDAVLRELEREDDEGPPDPGG